MSAELAAAGLDQEDILTPSCEYMVAGCAECLAEQEFRSGGADHQCDDLCEVFGRMKREDPSFHAHSHLPERCEGCQAVLDDNRGNTRFQWGVCKAGYCNLVLCLDCGYEVASMGPVECPSCGTFHKPERLKRIRRMYAARR